MLEGAGNELSSDIILAEGNSEKASFQQTSLVDIVNCEAKPMGMRPVSKEEHTCDIEQAPGFKKVDTMQSSEAEGVILSSA